MDSFGNGITSSRGNVLHVLAFLLSFLSGPFPSTFLVSVGHLPLVLLLLW